MAFVISHKYKFVYVHIPKTGGTSLCRYRGGGYLNDILPKTDIKLPHRHVIFAKEYLDEYYVWATLRNPYDRFISIYLRACEVYGKRAFSQFVDEVMFNKLPMLQAFLTQRFWIQHMGKLLVENFVNFDNLVSETIQTLQKLGVPTDKPFPWLKKSNRKPWEEYYNQQDKEEIENIYKPDFELCKKYL